MSRPSLRAKPLLPATPPAPARHIGGSLLPSSEPRILAPIITPCGVLQVRALPDLDTHALFVTHHDHESIIAMHPNGYSCYSLAGRMLEQNERRILDQLDHIQRCGGLARSQNAVLFFAGLSHA